MPAVADVLPTPRVSSAPGSTPWFAPARLLATSARTWFVAAALGQLVFSLYVTVVYAGGAVSGDFSRWNQVITGYVPGDAVGNTAMGLHAVLALVILVGGASQLIPAIRRRWPAVHRWTGRSYFTAAGLTSVAGLYLLWVRGTVGDLSQHIAISLNAVILCTCSVLAWRTARARDFAAHRRWALRAWLAGNGVFFFRISVFLWLMINQRPVGFDADTFSGPFLTGLAFAVYVFLPISLLELYFRAQQSPAAGTKRLAAAGLFTLSLLTLAGGAAVSLIAWIPRMR